jgi:ParB-like chromosome segregation protein Spo0J
MKKDSSPKKFTPEVQWLSPEKLTPYAKNAKIHSNEQIDKIAGQIAAFGFTQPIVVDKDKIIIAGHGRREAAIRLGLAKVPVIVASHLDEYQAMAARIADNKVAEAPWDNELLKFDLGTLQGHEMDLKLTGFDLTEVEALLKGWDSDIEGMNNLGETSDSSMATIKIHCSHEQKGELAKLLQTTIDDSGFEGVELE